MGDAGTSHTQPPPRVVGRWLIRTLPGCRRVHYAMHSPRLYRKYHYIHHAYDPPFSLSGEIQHPVEFFFNILLPLMSGPLLFAPLTGTHGTLRRCSRHQSVSVGVAGRVLGMDVPGVPVPVWGRCARWLEAAESN